MPQTITVKIKLLPTKEQASILNAMSKEYISTINTLVSEMVAEKKSTKSKDISVSLPSAVKIKPLTMQKAYSRKQRRVNMRLFLYSRNLCAFGTTKTIRLMSPTFQYP